MKEINNILDSHSISEKDKIVVNLIKQQLLENEKLIWIGKPKYKFRVTPLEVGGYDVVFGPRNLYFVALALNCFFSYNAFGQGQIVKSIFFFILGLALFSLPDIIKEIRRRNTYYAISNKRIFFKLWGLKKSKRIIADFKIDLINDLRYEVHKDNSGVLYFLLNESPNFKTYDFSVGRTRHYPTFENIKTVVAVQNLVKEQIRLSCDLQA